MPTWDDLTAELSQLSKKNEYKLFRPLLESLQRMANAQVTSPDVVGGVLDIVKHIQADASKGADPHELAEQAASGFIQPQWNVEGNVNQANRDLFNQIYINIFDKNLSQLKQEMPDPGILLPVVLLVMTATEAQELAVGNAFAQYPEPVYSDEFNQLNALLAANWIKNYGDTPQDWKPFNGGNDTIADVIEEALGNIDGYEKPLVPQFIDIRMINEADKVTRRKLKGLRNNGCIVIMDDISIRHPIVQQNYRRSLLDAFPNVLIIRIAPANNVLNVVQQMIRFSERIVDLEFHKRYNVDFDGKCGQVSANLDLTHWLVEHMPQLLPEEEKAKGGIRGQMFR